MVLRLRPLLLRILTLATFLLLPGALIGLPILWYFRHAAARKNKGRDVAMADGHCTHCG
jgi:hypothetical protein